MAIHYRTQGFILKKKDLGEADRIFTIFTRDFGKLEILAKAIRKIGSKLRGGIELFYLSDIEFIQGKTHKTLTDTILIESFLNLRKDLKRLKIAFDISEMIDSLIRGEERDEKIWKLLRETFERLNKIYLSIKECWLIYYYFLWNFLSILGYKPQLNFCSICQKKLVPQDLYFSFQEGGVICANCSKKLKEKKKISPEAVKILRLVFGKDFDFLKKLKVEKEQQKEIKEISESYLSHIKESQAKF
ncbi:MAG: DNA repair protein RecO [Candidatus Nealsonbacteria bacterium CG_4_10_14_0_8_um_filter_35_10]|uniref:DNA repair protein RecO n=1 Tax=Candidatus Nealsonbacteria bacterium CG_4_10_14_0_8_um_filter_35_10 TaxID=1974683 RepID=A0A2M7R7T1_9BACT|nr:MAG: DNA repair protein RecO [Candidatus Nealsonbacteria bacterium CG_4_10_14_0_8_um_filter_35_10]